MPHAWHRDLQQDSADPSQGTVLPRTCQDCGASGKTFLKKRKILLITEEEVRVVEVGETERNNLLNTKVREEGDGRSAPGTTAKTPLQHLERSWLPHCSLGRTSCWSRWICPKRKLQLLERTHAGTRKKMWGEKAAKRNCCELAAINLLSLSPLQHSVSEGGKRARN